MMNIYDLIFMACLSLHSGASCKHELLTCVLKYRDIDINAYLQNADFKKMTPDSFLSGQPLARWQEWVLDCAQEKQNKMQTLMELNKKKEQEKKK